MSNNFDLIIFDLDGTLIDSIEDIAVSYRQACNTFGYVEPPTSEVTLWVGQGHAVAIQNMYKFQKRQLEAGVELPALVNHPELVTVEQKFAFIYSQLEQFTALHSQLYKDISNTYTVVYPGVHKGLSLLKQQDVKLAVLTNKPKYLCGNVLAELGLAEYFDGVFADGDLQNNKPHPEGILKFMEQFKVSDPTLVLMVGDSKNDINAGKAANVITLGLSYGYNYGQPIAECNPDFVADNFSAVVALNKGITLNSSEYKQLVKDLEH